MLCKYALVAQWIERLVAVQKVAGSIPAKRTISKAFFALGASELLHLRQESKAGAMREFVCSKQTRRAPRGGVERNFRQEIYS